MVTALFVQRGTQLKRNDKLLTLEAMKMQSTIYAPMDGRVAEVLIETGQHIDAKDLLLVIE